MLQHSKGSVLLLCMAIVATLSLLAFGFIRVAQLHQDSHVEMTKVLLARESARMGTTHAIEQIIRDYVTEPFTRMDGPARAPFVPNDYPYLNIRPGVSPGTYSWDAAKSRYVGANLDDVSTESPIWAPLFTEWLTGGYAGTETIFNWASNGGPDQSYGGLVATDGRGAYIDPGWYNRFDGPSTATAPAKLRYGQDVTVLPDRNAAIFYDERWQRIAGDQLEARRTARYRLRYAVSVTDLDGELLMNPDPDMDYRHFNKANPQDYPNTTEPAGTEKLDKRTVRAQHALVPIIQAMGFHGSGAAGVNNVGCTGGMKAEHVFIGRGYTSNFDQTTADDAPRTFPLMFRNSTSSGQVNYQHYLNLPGASAVPPSPSYMDPAPSLFTMTGVAASITGEEAMPLPQSGITFRRSLMGPQYSFVNMDFALYSNAYNETWGGWDRDGQFKGYGCITPFGRATALDPVAGRYTGPCGTPWAVNIMTAPVQVVTGMVYGYMPPGAITSFSMTNTGTNDRHVWFGSRNSRDFFVKEMYPCFDPRTAPTAEGITPNYHTYSYSPGDPGYRGPTQRYPGEMAYNGFDAAGVWQHDTLGYFLRATKVANAEPGSPKTSVWTYGSTSGTVHIVAGDDTIYGDPPVLNPSPPPVYLHAPTVFTSELHVGDEVVINGVVRKISSIVSDAEAHTTVPWPISAPANTVMRLKLPVVAVSGDGSESMGGFDPYASVAFMKALNNWGEPPAPSRYYPRGGPTGMNTRSFTLIHPDSVWRAIAQAMAAAVAVARAQTMEYPTAAADPNTMFDGGAWTDVKVGKIEDIDKLFLANLGIDIANPTSNTPPVATGPQSSRAWYGTQNRGAGTAGTKVTFTSFTPGWNLATLNGDSLFDDNNPSTPERPHCPYTSAERTAAIELIINDFRLSFFGSSPAYTNFLAYDFNNDGKIQCSAFGQNVADPRLTDLGIDYYQMGSPSAAPPRGNMFCLSGCFTVTKSHFWRIMTRGEVWDNFYKTVVAQANLDTVLCVDPIDRAQELLPPASQTPQAGQFSTHVMYQRWVFDFNRGAMSRKTW